MAAPCFSGPGMPRILRNYLISFAIIGLVLLAIQLVNRWADQRAGTRDTAPAPAARSAPR